MAADERKAGYTPLEKVLIVVFVLFAIACHAIATTPMLWHVYSVVREYYKR